MALTLLVVAVLFFGMTGTEPSRRSYLLIGGAAMAATLWLTR